MSGVEVRRSALRASVQLTEGGIAYREAGDGPALVLLHGSSGSWRHWARNIEALSNSRRVVALDLPGYGDSIDIEAGVTIERYVALVVAAIQEICIKEGPIGLVGFSFGGQIAAAAAIELGTRVERLALLTPSGFEEPKGRVIELPRRKDFARSENGTREFHRRMLQTVMLSAPDFIDDLAIDIQSENISKSRFDGRHISWSGRMPNLLTQIPCPILLIYGDRDSMPFPSIYDRIERCQKVRADIQIALIPRAGHWLQYEEPAETNRLLSRFFDSAVPIHLLGEFKQS
jgi:2-hydroxy-6-oxonona-2,4-dienedioate hydrolase